MKKNPFKMPGLYLLIIFLCSLASVVQAKPGAFVQAFQMPAWIQRDAMKTPLKPGMEINSADIIITGKNARVLINLDDGGSQIKIGENASIHFDRLQPAEEAEGFFEGFIRVKSGALRYTTTASAQPYLRNLKINTAFISVDIKGTDVWMRSAPKEDNLVLIEGSVQANREGEPPFEMTQPLSWYRVPENKPAQLLPQIPQDKLARWAAETELLPGGGVVSRDGHWLVNLIALRDKKVFLKMRLKLAHQGIMTSVNALRLQGKQWYRLGVKGFATRADAEIFAQGIEGRYGLPRPWISRF